jgi:predicted ATPase
MYVESLSLTNFKSFAHAKTTFWHPDLPPVDKPGFLPNVTLLLSDNGIGKTTVLQGIALGVLATNIESSGFRPFHLVNKRALQEDPIASAKAEVALKLHSVDSPSGSSPMKRARAATFIREGDFETLSIGRHRDSSLSQDNSPASFLVAYATNRYAPLQGQPVSSTNRSRSARYQRVAGLFEGPIPLFPLGQWLPALRADHKDVAADAVELIKSVLPDGVSLTRKFSDVEPVLGIDSLELPLSALSDGYRTYLATVFDLVFQVVTCLDPKRRLIDLEGTILIDDVDLLLHPRWQRVVLHTLAKALPRLQFIVTSHSPIVAGTLHRENVRIVEDGLIRESEESLHGKSADQILWSPYFGLPSSRAPAMTKLLRDAELRATERRDPVAAKAYLDLLLKGSSGTDANGHASAEPESTAPTKRRRRTK